jgi:hypothetical protein
MSSSLRPLVTQPRGLKKRTYAETGAALKTSYRTAHAPPCRSLPPDRPPAEDAWAARLPAHRRAIEDLPQLLRRSPRAEKASPGTMSNNAGAPTLGQGYATLWPPLAKSGDWRFSRDAKPVSCSSLPKNCFSGPPRSATGSPVAPLHVVPRTPATPQKWPLVRFGTWTPPAHGRPVSGASDGQALRPIRDCLSDRLR